jgi:hypothetical protein
MINQMPTVGVNLGAPVAHYQRRFRANLFLGLSTLILGGLAIVMIYLGITAPPTSSAWVFYLFALLFLGGAGWVAYIIYQNRDLAVQVFTDGLIYTRNGQQQVIPWDSVTNVWQQVTKHYTNGVYTGTTHVYTIERADGFKVVCNDGLENVESLGNSIQQEITRRLLPKAIEAYNAGAVLPFGKLNISKQGIGNGKEVVPWPEVKGVKLQKGYVTVNRVGKWLSWTSTTVAQTPNFFIFLTLVDTIIGVK